MPSFFKSFRIPIKNGGKYAGFEQKDHAGDRNHRIRSPADSWEKAECSALKKLTVQPNIMIDHFFGKGAGSRTAGPVNIFRHTAAAGVALGKRA